MNAGTGAAPRHGFDTDTALDEAAAAALAAAGYTFCLRYVSLGPALEPGDLDAGEAGRIRAAGLALMPVQHGPAPGWWPSASSGASHGANAASHALAAGVPPGVNLWLDLEAVAAGAATSDIVGYCSAWYNAVVNGGYAPGLYVGANCGLDGQQLWQLPFEHYWKSMSKVPDIAQRGYQMVQAATTTVAGIAIDPDSAGTDALGGQPSWWAP